MELHLFEKGPHGLGMGTGWASHKIPPNEAFQAWPRLCATWLKERFFRALNLPGRSASSPQGTSISSNHTLATRRRNHEQPRHAGFAQGVPPGLGRGRRRAVRGDAGTGGPASEALALHGGPKAVTCPDAIHRDASRWPRYGATEENAVLEVLRNPGYSQNSALERVWKTHFQAPHVRAFDHGTSAIAAMFFALDLPAGSEVMVPSYTFFASIVPMRLFGLVPVFVDINPHTLNFDVEDARRRLTGNTRAVFPVHWFGNPCDMDDIGSFAREHGLIVLEDAVHAPAPHSRGSSWETGAGWRSSATS